MIDVGAAVVRAGVHDTDGKCLGIRTRLRPDPARHRDYAKLFEVYVRALAELRPILKELRSITQGIAPTS